MPQDANKKLNTEEGASFPLFFKNPAVLDAIRHKEAGIHEQGTYQFARKTNSIPINGIELVHGAKHYPIVFSMDSPSMLAIVGLEKDNYFVDERGNWKKNVYIPAYIRKYPFVFIDIPELQQLALCIDEGAEHFASKAGKHMLKLYDGEQPAQVALNALEFCTAYHKQFLATKEFCEALIEEHLLVESQSDVRLKSGRDIRLGGFRLIDQQKLEALPDDKVLIFYKKGWLPLIHFALQSATNWNQLVEFAARK